MKILIILFTLFTLAYSQQRVFVLDKYDKEIELEAKIVSKIANESLRENIKIYIPNISDQEKKIYSKYFEVSVDCESANFVFDKSGLGNNACKNLDKLYFTNNYRRLMSKSRYFGAFFWNKSRPNIVFVKQRLKKNGINLSAEYNQFIEEIDDK